MRPSVLASRHHGLLSSLGRRSSTGYITMSFIGSIVKKSLKPLHLNSKWSSSKNPNLETLCGFCASLFQKEHPILKSDSEAVSFDLGEIHQSPVDFQEAVKQQCRLCVLRWKQLSSEEQYQVRVVVKRIDLSISVGLKENHIHILFGYRLEDGGRSAKTITKTVLLVPDEGMHLIYTCTCTCPCFT
jgi:hypothetical protein